MSPEKTHKRNEKPHQAVQRERRQTKQKLMSLPPEVLSEARMVMAEELLFLTVSEGIPAPKSEREIVELLLDNPRLQRDIACA